MSIRMFPTQVRDLVAFKNHYDLSGPILLSEDLLTPIVADSTFFARPVAIPAADARVQFRFFGCLPKMSRRPQ